VFDGDTDFLMMSKTAREMGVESKEGYLPLSVDNLRLGPPPPVWLPLLIPVTKVSLTRVGRSRKLLNK